MILAVFIVAFAFAAVAEFQLRIRQFGPAADGAAVQSASRITVFLPQRSGLCGAGRAVTGRRPGCFAPVLDGSLEVLPAFHLTRVDPVPVPRPQPQEQEIEKRCHDGDPDGEIALDRFDTEENRIDDTQVFDLDRNNEHEQDLHVRKCHGVGKEDRHVHVVGAEHRCIGGKEHIRPVRRNGAPIEQIGHAHHQEGACRRKQDAGKDIDIVAPGSPGALQRRSDTVIERTA
jgi:hypothetical protein